jgi:hypothetical protein
MSKASELPAGDPFNGPVAGYWLFGYDMPDELGGGFVTGELLLRGDGVLLRRYSKHVTTADGKHTPGYGPWEEVSWWTRQPDPHRAAQILHHRGYDLHKRDIPPDREPG